MTCFPDYFLDLRHHAEEPKPRGETKMEENQGILIDHPGELPACRQYQPLVMWVKIWGSAAQWIPQMAAATAEFM